MRIVFIRHGKTAGNIEKRYIGRTDEPLCRIGISELTVRRYPDCDIVAASPMMRCIQTAEIIYPQREITKYSDLRECDFGDFEGRNYTDLCGDPDYQKWIDSGGAIAFPKGESPDCFRKRCIAAFEKAVHDHYDLRSISFVVHGGTIMSILEKYAVPKGNYFDYQVKNGSGYITEFDGEKIVISEKI